MGHQFGYYSHRSKPRSVVYKHIVNSKNVINNKGTTELDYVIVHGGRLGINNASGTLKLNHTIVQNTSNKGIVVAGGTATIKNTTTQDTGTTGLFLYSNAQTVAIDNMTVKNINSDKDAHGVNIEAGVVTVTSTESGSVGLKVDTVTGHGIVVKGPAQLNASKIKAAGMALIGTGFLAIVAAVMEGFFKETTIRIELDFFIWGAVILAIAYIFNYGCKLQQESDETI